MESSASTSVEPPTANSPGGETPPPMGSAPRQGPMIVIAVAAVIALGVLLFVVAQLVT